MSVRREITEYDGIYFVTITCSGWRHLFHLSDGYAEVYKWFDHLKGQGHYIVGYVIMPNHLHALIGFRNPYWRKRHAFAISFSFPAELPVSISMD